MARAAERADDRRVTAPPQPAASPAGAGAPLSFASRAVHAREWAGGGGRAAELLLYVWRVGGPLEATGIERALAQLMQRHEPLRTTFAPTGRGVRQLVHHQLTPRLEQREPDGRGSEARLRSALTQATALARRPLWLDRGPLWRVVLWRLGALDHVLSLVVAHAIWDAWSAGVFVRELLALHGGVATTALPPLPLQLADVAEWERSLPAAPHARAPAPLPGLRRGDDHLPVQSRFRVARPADGAGLARLARVRRTTTSVVLLAAFVTLLAAKTGAARVTTAVADARRDDPRLEHALGYFVGFRLVTVAVDRDAAFGALATALHRQLHVERPPSYDALLAVDPQAGCDVSFNVVPPAVTEPLEQPVEAGGLTAERIADVPAGVAFPTRARPWRTRFECELWCHSDGAIDAHLLHDACALPEPAAAFAGECARLLRQLASAEADRTPLGALIGAGRW